MLRTLKSAVGRIRRASLGVLQSLERVPDMPRSASMGAIGSSVKGRPIECYRLGDGAIKVALVGAIHGNEVGTAKLVRYAASHIADHAGDFPPLSLLLLPVLNVDGYAEATRHPEYLNDGRRGRFNANGVDLNRNFDTPSFASRSWWSFGKDYAERAEVFCGDAGGSEPEVKSLCAFLESEGVRAVISFHNAGRDVMPGSSDASRKLASAFSHASGYPIVSDEAWIALGQTGTFREWCDQRGIDFLEVEGTTRWGSDWSGQREALRATLAVLNGS